MRIRFDVACARFLSGMAIVAGALCLSAAGSATVLPEAAETKTPMIRYSPGSGETHVAVNLRPNLCLAFSLPREWHGEFDETGAFSLGATAGDGEIEISVRSVRELIDLPQPDPVSRDAAFLQLGHETLLGRPAQASTLEAVSGATRWTATWVDANLPSPTRSLTVETYIVPASREWLLELSISEVDDRRTYDDLVRRLLSNLRTVRSSPCGRMS